MRDEGTERSRPDRRRFLRASGMALLAGAAPAAADGPSAQAAKGGKAVLDLLPESIPAGWTLTASALRSLYAHPEDYLPRFRFDWDDSSYAEGLFALAPHVYALAGHYTVRLTLTLPTGRQYHDHQSIRVTPPPPVVAPGAVVQSVQAALGNAPLGTNEAGAVGALMTAAGDALDGPGGLPAAVSALQAVGDILELAFLRQQLAVNAYYHLVFEVVDPAIFALLQDEQLAGGSLGWHRRQASVGGGPPDCLAARRTILRDIGALEAKYRPLGFGAPRAEVSKVRYIGDAVCAARPDADSFAFFDLYRIADQWSEGCFRGG